MRVPHCEEHASDGFLRCAYTHQETQTLHCTPSHGKDGDGRLHRCGVPLQAEVACLANETVGVLCDCFGSVIHSKFLQESAKSYNIRTKAHYTATVGPRG